MPTIFRDMVHLVLQVKVIIELRKQVTNQTTQLADQEEGRDHIDH
jgi:hypothetical protein